MYLTCMLLASPRTRYLRWFRLGIVFRGRRYRRLFALPVKLGHQSPFVSKTSSRRNDQSAPSVGGRLLYPHATKLSRRGIRAMNTSMQSHCRKGRSWLGDQGGRTRKMGGSSRGRGRGGFLLSLSWIWIRCRQSRVSFRSSAYSLFVWAAECAP